jgi:hypothetical protein
MKGSVTGPPFLVGGKGLSSCNPGWGETGLNLDISLALLLLYHTPPHFSQDRPELRVVLSRKAGPPTPFYQNSNKDKFEDFWNVPDGFRVQINN